MKPPFHRIATGLVWAMLGTGTVFFDWVLVVVAAFGIFNRWYEFPYLLLGILAVGLLFGLVGRCLCLAVPKVARAARAWSVLAVAFEVSGLCCGVIFFVLVQFRIFPGAAVSIGAVLFSLGGLVLGRVAFAFFVRSLAKHIGEEMLARRALLVFWHAVAVVAGVVFVTWVLSANYSGIEIQRCWVVVMTLFITHWTWRHLRLLIEVRSVARDYFPPLLDANDDPDRVYRERYEREHGPQTDPTDD
jgi:hypothetical protein